MINSYGLDRVAAVKVIDTYRRSLQETLVKLHTAVLEQDGDEGVSSAHSLKGACLNLGLYCLAEKASTLEKELRKDILEYHSAEVLYFEDALRPLTDRKGSVD